MAQVEGPDNERGKSNCCGQRKCDQAVEKNEAGAPGWFVCRFIGRCEMVFQVWVWGVRARIVTHI
jgi:hypothetical protein